MSGDPCPLCGAAADGHEVFVTTADGAVVACLTCYLDHPVLITARWGHYQTPIVTSTPDQLRLLRWQVDHPESQPMYASAPVPVRHPRRRTPAPPRRK